MFASTKLPEGDCPIAIPQHKELAALIAFQARTDPLE
jgi:hypothetical protein